MGAEVETHSSLRIDHHVPGDLQAATIADLKERVERLSRQVDQWKRTHESLLLELRLAEQVQRAMLPRVLPRPVGVEFGAGVRPLQHLAGDFYNVFRLDQHRVGFYLGDVVGHGPAAALLSVFVMQTIRPKRIEGTAYEVLPPAAVMEQLNRDVIAAEFPDEPFLTMVYGVLDTTRRLWTYCSCGHPPALVLRPGEASILLEVTAPIVGVFEAPFEQAETTLAPGDRLVLYSDGSSTAVWGRHGQGIAGLISSVAIRDDRSPQNVVDDALSVAGFDGQPSDDVAVLVAQIDL